MYTYANPEQVFGAFGAAGDWWEALDATTKIRIQNWIVDQAAMRGAPINVAAITRDVTAVTLVAEIPVTIANMILASYARPVADGGGFVVEEARAGLVGRGCLCPSNTPAGGIDPATGTTLPPASDTSPLANGRCPAGTGGVPLREQKTINRKLFVSEQKVRVQPRPPGSDATKATIKGKVVDASGAGIAGAAVRVTPPGGSVGALLGQVASVVTGSDGSFSADVKPVAASTVDVAVTAAGYVVATASGVVAIRGQTTSDVMIPLTAAGGAPPPPTCDPGFVLDLVTAACVPVPGDGGPPPITCPDGSVLAADGVTCVTAGGGFTCPVGYALAPDGVSCVALGEKTGEAVKPWYKSKWTYIIIGGGVLLLGGVAVAVSRRRK